MRWRLALALAALAAAASAPLAAQSRTTRLLVQDLAAGSRISPDKVERRTALLGSDDFEVIPGL